MSTQLFDTKAETAQVYNSFLGVVNYLAAQRVKFWDDAYFCYLLADYLYGKIPASKAMPLIEWRKSFNHIIQAFNLSGTIETYITMIKGLFSADAVIEFTITGPAELEIDINVTAGEGLEKIEICTDDDEIFITDQLENIYGVKILETIDSNDLEAVLQATAPVGISVTFNIISE